MEVFDHINYHLDHVRTILTSPSYNLPVCLALLAVDAVLSTLILNKVAYTEIDWRAYMQQVAIYRSGERDYNKIRGDTGPLVYGAGHVYIYDFLYKLTGSGKDIWTGQCIFAGTYLLALGLVMACYSRAKAPPYLFALLISSKRLHSIFILRLFNDCFAVLALFLAIYAYQSRFYTVGSLAFSFGLAIKLPLALAFPGVAVILFQALESRRALNNLNIMLQLQVLLGYPFWTTNSKAYFGRAFELGRQFLFKWTVNWRFVGEQWFLSKEFAYSLLAANAALLLIFVLTRWLRPSGLSPIALASTIFKSLPPKIQQEIARKVDPNYVLTTILTSLIVGMLCARSLHYQFYAYVAWSTPFLLWRSGAPPYAILSVWIIQELAWNIYPSTSESSLAAVGCLAYQVAGVWLGTKQDLAKAKPPVKAYAGPHKRSD